MDVRKSGEDWKITEVEFKRRYLEQFFDPYFDSHRRAIDELAKIAWKSYSEGRKAPRTVAAGEEFEDPDYQLSVEWLRAREKIALAKKEHDDPQGPSRVLLISAAHRSDHTCPGEISKSRRLKDAAERILKEENVLVETLDLSDLADEYGKKIYPCKACVSTAMPLCHWPCSCYPNHSLGQVQDWMNDIYPMWVRAHGVMIITPVYWHQSPSALKLMMDRMVCADGGNPDPTTTQGKDPMKAKELEMKGWDYPRHLRGRIYSVVVHGDTLGVDDSKNTLCDWLDEIELIPSSASAKLARYIGYYGPYATSHEALDDDFSMFGEVRNAALSLAITVAAQRQGSYRTMESKFRDPRPK